MNSATIEYKRDVWKFLETIEPDKTYTVTRLSKPETREAFIEAIKEYMAAFPWDGWLNFNADYSKIYKVHPIVFKGA